MKDMILADHGNQRAQLRRLNMMKTILVMLSVALLMSGCIGVETNEAISTYTNDLTNGECDLQFPFVVVSGTENYTFADDGIIRYDNKYGHLCSGTWIITDVHSECGYDQTVYFEIALVDDEIQGPFGNNIEWIPTIIRIHGKPIPANVDIAAWQYEQQAKVIKCPDATGQNNREIHAMWRTI